MSVELPPLPEPAWKWTEQPMNLQRILGGRPPYPPPYPIYGFHSEDQMRAYARAAVDAALEAVIANAASKGWAMKDESAFEDSVRDVAEEAIRAMRSGVENI